MIKKISNKLMVLYCLSGCMYVCVCLGGGGVDGAAEPWFKVHQKKKSVCTTKSNEIYFQYGLYTRHDH